MWTGKLKPRLLKSTRYDTPVFSAGAVAERITLRPIRQRHPTSRWSGLPEDSRNPSGRPLGGATAGGVQPSRTAAEEDQGGARALLRASAAPPALHLRPGFLSARRGRKTVQPGRSAWRVQIRVSSLGKLLQILESLHKAVFLKRVTGAVL